MQHFVFSKCWFDVNTNDAIFRTLRPFLMYLTPRTRQYCVHFKSVHKNDVKLSSQYLWHLYFAALHPLRIWNEEQRHWYRETEPQIYYCIFPRIRRGGRSGCREAGLSDSGGKEDSAAAGHWHCCPGWQWWKMVTLGLAFLLACLLYYPRLWVLPSCLLPSQGWGADRSHRGDGLTGISVHKTPLNFNSIFFGEKSVLYTEIYGTLWESAPECGNIMYVCVCMF